MTDPTAYLEPKTGRNKPCLCGSGKKYKLCCLPKDEAAARKANEEEPSPAEQPRLPHVPFNAGLENASARLSFFETHTEPVDDLPEEVDDKLMTIWEAFEALKKPNMEQMNALLESLLRLPPEATVWHQLFHTFARLEYVDLPGLFRRIDASVPHELTGMSYFYWAVADEFDARGHRALLPEVAQACCRLDLDSYDSNALHSIEDYLVAGGFEEEALRMSEHILPILRQDNDLLGWVVPAWCRRIFELRAGRMLLVNSASGRQVQDLAAELVAGLDEELSLEFATAFASVVAATTSDVPMTIADFELASADINENAAARQTELRLHQNLLRIAGEAHRSGQFPPGCAFRVLCLLPALTREFFKRRIEGKRKLPRNLLDCLQVRGMEERLVKSCRALIGLNVGKARLLLRAHELLARFAVRHRLIPAEAGASTDAELKRLRSKLELPQPVTGLKSD